MLTFVLIGVGLIAALLLIKGLNEGSRKARDRLLLTIGAINPCS